MSQLTKGALISARKCTKSVWRPPVGLCPDQLGWEFTTLRRTPVFNGYAYRGTREGEGEKTGGNRGRMGQGKRGGMGGVEGEGGVREGREGMKGMGNLVISESRRLVLG